MSYLGVELASRPKFEGPKFGGNDLRPKDLSYISALQSTPSLRPQNSNRESELSETGLTKTKHSSTRSNRERTSISQTSSLRSPLLPFRPQAPTTKDRNGTRPRTCRAAQPPTNPQFRTLSRSEIRNCRATKTSKTQKTPKSHPQFWFRLETHPVLYFVQVTEILIEPMFRLEMRSERIKIETRTRTNSDGKNQNRGRNASPPGRIKNYPRWEFT